MQGFVDASPLRAYDLRAHSGVWRQASVRWAASSRGLAVDLLASPPGTSQSDVAAAAAVSSTLSSISSETAELYQAELLRFVADMQKLEGADIRTVSVCLQEYSGNSSPDPSLPHTFLHGPRTVEERLCGLRFAVSPGAFFQVNNAVAERLYFLVRALAVDGIDGGRRVSSSPCGDAPRRRLSTCAAVRAQLAL